MSRIVLVLVVLGLLAACSSAAAPPTPARVVDAFKAAGLEANNPRPLTRDMMGMAPMTHTDALLFGVTGGPCTATPPNDCNGRVFVFKDETDLKTTHDFYVNAGKASAAFFSHTFRHGLVLVQINGNLPEAQAKAYDAALQAMR